MKVETGKIMATQAVYDRTTRSPDFKNFVESCALQYMRGKWGDLPEDDSEANREAARTGGRILARYKNDTHGDIYIITEADRTFTTVLFCDEY